MCIYFISRSNPLTLVAIRARHTINIQDNLYFDLPFHQGHLEDQQDLVDLGDLWDPMDNEWHNYAEWRLTAFFNYFFSGKLCWTYFWIKQFIRQHTFFLQRFVVNIQKFEFHVHSACIMLSLKILEMNIF